MFHIENISDNIGKMKDFVPNFGHEGVGSIRGAGKDASKTFLQAVVGRLPPRLSGIGLLGGTEHLSLVFFHISKSILL